MKINENVDVSQDNKYSDYCLLKNTLREKMLWNSFCMCDSTLYQNLTENKLKFSKCYELNFSQKSLPGLDMKKLSNATQTCR